MTVNDDDLRTFGCTRSCGHFDEIVELHTLRQLVADYFDTEHAKAFAHPGAAQAHLDARFALMQAVGR